MALIALKPARAADKFKELKESDIAMEEYSAGDLKALKKLGCVGSNFHRNAPSGKRTKMSWIWTSNGGPNDQDRQMHDAIRVQWTKALARKTRWSEELALLREEMRHVLRFVEWQAEVWEARTAVDPAAVQDVFVALRPDVLSGLHAYAHKQAAIFRALGASYRKR
ncbi:hypothetical protein HGRIS_011075 [Hohenbuehelia grisea]|uniref:Uncharacterized protein n=1 Tax=Hohenbuehelia grisea TaxID=104357 RepID=A0ABR3IYR8_9AGAR